MGKAHKDGTNPTAKVEAYLWTVVDVFPILCDVHIIISSSFLEHVKLLELGITLYLISPLQIRTIT